VVESQGGGDGYLCIASFNRLLRWPDVPTFMRLTFRVQNQLSQSRAVVRYGFKANLLRRHFWTFSIWADPTSSYDSRR
jgi:hypothetical protein